MPEATGPQGSCRASAGYSPYQSVVHSVALPNMSKSPQGLGSCRMTGDHMRPEDGGHRVLTASAVVSDPSRVQ